jgi:hypothetical protein
MFTTLLAYVIALAGLVMIAAGIWGVRIVIVDYKSGVPVPARYYAITIGMVAGGLGLIGLAQALRLLLVLVGKV